MKVFFCGDFEGMSGPAIANKNMKMGFEAIQKTNDMFYYTKATTKIGRISELVHMVGCDWAVVCSASRFNKLVIRLANILGIKIAYIMHGLASYEEELNEGDNIGIKKAKKHEKFILKKTDKIIAVSKKFCMVLQSRYPQYKKKISYCFNSISSNILIANSSSENRKKRIISVGGAMPRKNMIPVCKAIERINQKEHTSLDFYIIGKNKIQMEQISGYSCVKYIESLDHKELMRMLQDGGIYIQNSLFETYGLTIVEALSQGCDIIISQYVGVLDLFGHLEDSDIIYDPMNVDEIEKKIKYILEHGNRQKLCKCFEWNKVKPNYQAEMILKQLREEGI